MESCGGWSSCHLIIDKRTNWIWFLPIFKCLLCQVRVSLPRVSHGRSNGLFFSALRIWRVGRGNLPIFYVPIQRRRSMRRVTCVWWHIRSFGCVHCFRPRICECMPADVVVVGRRRDAHTAQHVSIYSLLFLFIVIICRSHSAYVCVLSAFLSFVWFQVPAKLFKIALISRRWAGRNTFIHRKKSTSNHSKWQSNDIFIMYTLRFHFDRRVTNSIAMLRKLMTDMTWQTRTFSAFPLVQQYRLPWESILSICFCTKFCTRIGYRRKHTTFCHYFEIYCRLEQRPPSLSLSHSLP